MSIQRLFFSSQIKNSDDPAKPLLLCLRTITPSINHADSVTNNTVTYNQQTKESAQIGVEVVSGSISVNGISYLASPYASHQSQDVALIRLPPKERIYIDNLSAKPALLYVSEGSLELSGIPLQEKQLAWITDIEQMVITAVSTSTQTVLIKHN